MSASTFDFVKWFRIFGQGGFGGRSNGNFWGYFSGTGGNWAGEPVSVDIAMQLSTVWKCIRLNSSIPASLPLNLVSTDDKGTRAPADLPVQNVINDSPNDEQTALEFWEAIIGSMEASGNGFARKRFRGSGVSREVIALSLLDPRRVTWERRANNRILWRYTDLSGGQVDIPDDEMFQLKQFSFDGVMGLSAIAYGAQTFSGSRAADRLASEFFAKGMSSSGFLQTQQELEEPDRKRLQQIMDEYRGKAGAGKLMILEGGMTYNPMTISAEDAQLLSSRQFNIEEMCRWFDIPPILVGHSSQGQTNWGTGVETIILGWLQLGLRSRLVRIQQRIRKQLLTPAQRVEWTPKYNIDALMQGDSAARIAFLGQAVQNGLMNRNEARAKLDQPPYPGGEEFTAQVNLAPVNALGDNSNNDSAVVRAAVKRWLGIDETPTPPQIEHKPAS